MRIAAVLNKIVIFLLLYLAACSPKAGQVRPEQPAKAISINSLEVGKAGDRALLTIKATEQLQGRYTVIKLSDPPKVIVEMQGVDVGKFEGPLDGGNGAISKVLTSRLNGSGVRMEIVLTSDVEHEVKADGSALEIYFATPPVSEPGGDKTGEKLKAENAPQEKAEPVAEAAPAPEEKTAAPAAVAEAPKKDEKTGKALKVTDVKIKKAGKFTRAEIITDGEPAVYNVFDLKAPARVVVDLGNAREISAKKEIKVASPHIKGARLGRYDGQVRVVFDYKGSVQPYEVVRGKDRISILFGKKPLVAAVKSEKEAAREEPAKIAEETKAEERAKAPADETPGTEVKPETKEASAATEAGEGAKTEARPEVPKEEIRPEIKAEEKAARPETAKETAKVKAEEKGEKAIAKQAEVAAEVKPEVEKAEAKPKVEEAKAKVEAEIKGKAREEARPQPEAEKKGPAEGGKEDIVKVYNGQKVTLEFKDADIKNIFRIIAEVSGYNMIIDNAVTGKVTIRLVNVPWDQALDILLETNNLGMKKVGNVIRVVPASLVKKEEEDRLASKKAIEKMEDLVTKLVPVSYAKASDLSTKLKGAMSDRGSSIVDERTNTIVLKDIQKNIDEAEKLVKDLDTPTPQISIEARIVEAGTTFTRSLGVNWGTGFNADAAHGNPTGYYFPNSYGITAGGGGSAINLPTGTAGSVAGGGAVGINFGSINNTLNLDLRLSASELQGETKVLSSPKIITLDNKEASIQQGVSIPFQTTSASGTQTQFIDANLNLTVTPHVTADGRLTMKIKASKNSPNTSVTGAGGAPSIDKNEATTEILVKDGDTAVIGGIYTIDKGETITGVPLLKDIPLIGGFFRSKSKTNNKKELLIFITPRIVRDKPV